jgi:hypothetical protein
LWHSESLLDIINLSFFLSFFDAGNVEVCFCFEDVGVTRDPQLENLQNDRTLWSAVSNRNFPFVTNVTNKSGHSTHYYVCKIETDQEIIIALKCVCHVAFLRDMYKANCTLKFDKKILRLLVHKKCE